MAIPKYTPSEIKRDIGFIASHPDCWLHFFSYMVKKRNWIDLKSDSRRDYSIIKNKQYGFVFHSTFDYGRLMIREWDLWEKTYSFPFTLQGKTVLDVGAGCGETALFYFCKGVSRVICIEKDITFLFLFNKNKDENRLNMDLIIEPFSLKHLMVDFDAVKMDIEGGEAELLKLGEIGFPIVIEVHSRKLEDAFRKRGFVTSMKLRSSYRQGIYDYVVTMNNFEVLNVQKIQQ